MSERQRAEPPKGEKRQYEARFAAGEPKTVVADFLCHENTRASEEV